MKRFASSWTGWNRPPHGRWLAVNTVLAAVLLTATACGAAAPAASSLAAKPVASGDGWEAQWNAALAAAKQERTVVVWGPPGDVIRRNMLDGFKKAFPDIALEWEGGQSPELAIKLDAQRRAGTNPLDIFIAGTSVQLAQVKPSGALDPLKPALILPEVTNTQNWLDNKLEWADRDGQLDLAFAILVEPMILYDPKLVTPDAVDQLNSLLDPKWKGKMVFEDPRSGGAGLAWFRWLWAMLGPDKGADYFKAIKAQAGAIARDRRQMVEWVAHGTYTMLLHPSTADYEQLRSQGITNLAILPEFKEYGSYITPAYGSVTLINKAPHPNAAKVFVNWLLSKDGQTAYSTAVGAPSRRLDVPTGHLPSYALPKPGVKYWPSYFEDNAVPSAELNAQIKQVFGG